MGTENSLVPFIVIMLLLSWFVYENIKLARRMNLRRLHIRVRNKDTEAEWGVEGEVDRTPEKNTAAGSRYARLTQPGRMHYLGSDMRKKRYRKLWVNKSSKAELECPEQYKRYSRW